MRARDPARLSRQCQIWVSYHDKENDSLETLSSDRQVRIAFQFALSLSLSFIHSSFPYQIALVHHQQLITESLIYFSGPIKKEKSTINHESLTLINPH